MPGTCGPETSLIQLFRDAVSGLADGSCHTRQQVRRQPVIGSGQGDAGSCITAGTVDSDGHRAQPRLALPAVQRVPVPANLLKLGKQARPRANGLRRELLQLLVRVQLIQALVARRCQQGLATRRAVRRKLRADPRCRAQRPRPLDAVQIEQLSAAEPEPVDGFVELVDELLDERAGLRPDVGSPQRRQPHLDQGRAGGVLLGRSALLGKAVMSERGQQPVRGRAGDGQMPTRLRDAYLGPLPEHEQELERIIDRLDGIARAGRRFWHVSLTALRRRGRMQLRSHANSFWRYEGRSPDRARALLPAPVTWQSTEAPEALPATLSAAGPALTAWRPRHANSHRGLFWFTGHCSVNLPAARLGPTMQAQQSQERGPGTRCDEHSLYDAVPREGMVGRTLTLERARQLN